jgi:hypothetical protein
VVAAAAVNYPQALVKLRDGLTFRQMNLEASSSRGVVVRVLPHKAETMLCFMAAAVVLRLLRQHQGAAVSGAAAVAVVVTLLLRQGHPRLVATAALAVQQVRLELNPVVAGVVAQPLQVLAALAKS